jgi:ATP-binding cassette, subfamily B, bacterial MsbA
MRAIRSCAVLVQQHWPAILTAMALATVATTLQALVTRLLLYDVVDLAKANFPVSVRLGSIKHVYEGIPVTVGNADEAIRVVLRIMFVVVGMTVAAACTGCASSYLLERVTYRTMRSARNQLHRKILSLPLSAIAAQRTGDLMARAVSDVRHLTATVHAFSNALKATVMIVVLLTVLFLDNWLLSAGTFVFVPVIGFIIYSLGRRIRRSSARFQEQLGAVTERLEQNISGLSALKAFGAEKAEHQNFNEDTRRMYRTGMRRVRVFVLQGPATEVVMVTGMAGIFGFGCWLVLEGTMTFGALLAHVGIGAMLANPLRKVGQFYAQFQQGLPSIERIDAVHDLPSEDMDAGRSLAQVTGSIRFEGVSFRYTPDGDTVLRDVSLVAEEGQTVALVGRSGAGKTSLLHLIPRFYAPTSGRILLDGVDAADIALHSLRGHMALVPQDTMLFAGTVAENVRLARPDATDAEVRRAATQAFADEFIMGFDEGYATQIGERGDRLSGGQRQRIAIARAFLKDPRVFLLDEATASLDAESEAMVQKSFAELMRDRTTFVIAHRLSTVLHADVILVMDAGRIVERGRHADLLEAGGLYAELFTSQLGGALTPAG